MTASVRTAKDLPVGAEVAFQGDTWVKDGPGLQQPWTRQGTRAHISDEGMDHVLREGGFITVVPSRPQQPMVAACGVCLDWHFNACPVNWGGNPETVPAARRLPLVEVP